MNKNPYYNAIFAAAYIVLLVSGVFSFPGPDQRSIILPITILSMLVLSVCVMSYLMVLQPLMMYIDGQKKEAMNFFMKSVATFAGICALFLITLVFILS